MKSQTFLHKHERWLPIFLALLFIVLTSSGLATMHNPDELLHRVMKALDGRWAFDETNFDYPSLPKYLMFGVGKIAYALGFVDEFPSIARFLSILLGGGIIFLVYKITRNIGGGVLSASFAALFLLSNHEIAINARFAHNDLYLTFFLTLAVYFLVKYQKIDQRAWLYSSFFCVGLAASSKYNGGVFLLVPLLIFVFTEREHLLREKIRTFETLFISTILTASGFVLGTPKALLWMSFYFKRVMPALARHATFGQTAGGEIGFFGQWAIMKEALGETIYYLFLISFLYFTVKMASKLISKNSPEKRNFFGDAQARKKETSPISIFLLAIIVFDLPIMSSYNYQARFFIPLMPFLAILAGLFIEDFQKQIKEGAYKKYFPFMH